LAAVSEYLSWEREGRDWPNRETSRFPVAAGIRWHVQVMGEGPVALLIHGSGAATHSWRDLAPLLAKRFEVIAPDLPGHGFSEAPPRRGLSLELMTDALAQLLGRLEKSPALVVGHSAGAAILTRMCLSGQLAPRGVVSLNGALLPLNGVPGYFFSPMARLLAATPLLPHLFAWHASAPDAVDRLVRSTGSVLEPRGVELYRRLIESPGHVAATLSMLANWELEFLSRELPRLQQRLFLVVGENDWTVPPSESRRVSRLLTDAELISLPGLGHLAHEERPAEVADLIGRLAVSAGIPLADP
jgi:magnesium chelatase accessory protein